ncbi:MAG: DUF192 domain-containing protein [Gammaproteobacteria bacterium]|nr:DUF192 domain-containing protein [Gammaproteobacteria bacterium]NNF66597.1 DUF192 domain-containing protein [Gammaproteobacteria bacterium]
MASASRLAALILVLACASCANNPDPALTGFFSAPLSIESRTGSVHDFTVYLAKTPQQRAQGLMFVRKLPNDYGMLFVYENSRQISMWMKNTVLPLDMLFVRQDGIITRIVHNTVPGSLQSISSGSDVKAVLELKAGSCDKLGIKPGDKVIYRAFGTDPNDAVSPASGPH